MARGGAKGATPRAKSLPQGGTAEAKRSEDVGRSEASFGTATSERVDATFRLGGGSGEDGGTGEGPRAEEGGVLSSVASSASFDEVVGELGREVEEISKRYDLRSRAGGDASWFEQSARSARAMEDSNLWLRKTAESAALEQSALEAIARDLTTTSALSEVGGGGGCG
jgi:hypothetical protein